MAIRVNSPHYQNFNLQQIENTAMEKNRAEDLLKGSNEALMTLTNELKKIKKVLLAAVMTNDEIELSKLNTDTIGGSSSANHPDTY